MYKYFEQLTTKNLKDVELLEHKKDVDPVPVKNLFKKEHQYNFILDLISNKIVIDIKKDNKLFCTVFINNYSNFNLLLNDLINLNLNKNFKYNLNVLY